MLKPGMVKLYHLLSGYDPDVYRVRPPSHILLHYIGQFDRAGEREEVVEVGKKRHHKYTLTWHEWHDIVLIEWM